MLQTFYKIKKLHFARVIETFLNSSIFVIPPRNWGDLFKIHHKEAPSIYGAAANLSIKSVLFFKKNFVNIGIKKKDGVGQVRACLDGAHSCMSF